MTIYCINYESGEYEDYTNDFVGGYSTKEKREIALDKIKRLKYNEIESWRTYYELHPDKKSNSGDNLVYPEGKEGILTFWEFEVDNTVC